MGLRIPMKPISLKFEVVDREFNILDKVSLDRLLNYLNISCLYRYIRTTPNYLELVLVGNKGQKSLKKDEHKLRKYIILWMFAQKLVLLP
jgi:hypothetical protein